MMYSRDGGEDTDGQQRCERESAGFKSPSEAYDDATNGAAREDSRVDLLEPQMNAIERRLGNPTQQAGHERACGGLAHLLVTLPHRQDHDTSRRTEAGEVPGAHWALNVVRAPFGDVDDHDRIDRPVQAERHHERVGQRNEDGEDEGPLVDPLQRTCQTGTCVHLDGGSIRKAVRGSMMMNERKGTKISCRFSGISFLKSL